MRKIVSTHGPLALATLLLAGFISSLFVSARLAARPDQRPKPETVDLAKSVIISGKCGSCHTLQARGLELTGKVGPDLTHEGRRQRSAEWLRRRLTDAASIPDEEILADFLHKRDLMPRLDTLSERELSALVEFLQSLR